MIIESDGSVKLFIDVCLTVEIRNKKKLKI